MSIEEYSAYTLMSAVLSGKSFKHPNPDVLEGTYEFVRFNNNGTVALNNIKTRKRINLDLDIIFSSMKTTVPEGYLEKVIHGASGQEVISVLDRKKNDVFLKQVSPDEIGKKYKLVKGQKNLYEQSQPKYTKSKAGISNTVSELFFK